MRGHASRRGPLATLAGLLLAMPLTAGCGSTGTVADTGGAASAELPSSGGPGTAGTAVTPSTGPTGPTGPSGATPHASGSAPDPGRGKVVQLGGKGRTATSVDAPTSVPSSDGDALHQWASGATATSNYGPGASDSWNAARATGAPDVDPACGDNPRAWASLLKDERATLTLTYDTAVWATEINVYQTYNPGQITKIDLIGPGGEVTTVYEGTPAAPTGCPVQGYLRELSLPHTVGSIAITVDQSVLGTGWIEIDAVELVGLPPS